jgi:uncharacterized membrane protein
MDKSRSEGQLKKAEMSSIRVRIFSPLAVLMMCVLVTGPLSAQDSAKTTSSAEVSFKKDIAPVLDKFCVTCHTSEDDHPSELYMDTYDSLMKGGKHGKAIVPGNSRESLLVQKMSENPPFGKFMPPPRKPRPTPEQAALIQAWIDQGAGKN